MMPSNHTILLISLIPASCILIGSIFAGFFKLKKNLLSNFQHFVAGILIAAVALELIPPITKSPSLSIVFGLALGAIAMLVLKGISDKIGTKSSGLITASMIDLMIDGVILAITFLAGLKSGFVVALALSFETLSLSFTIRSTLHQQKISTNRQFITLLLLLIALPLGALIGTGVISVLPPLWLNELLAFGIAALLFLAIEELLGKAHQKPETLLPPALFFAGFIIIFCLKIMITQST